MTSIKSTFDRCSQTKFKKRFNEIEACIESVSSYKTEALRNPLISIRCRLQIRVNLSIYTSSVEVQYDIEGVLLKLLFKVYHIKV